MIIHNPVITGSLQVNGSSVASIESLDSTSGSVAALNNATSSYAVIAEISGSTTALSSSLEGRISDNETSVSSLNSASSSYALQNSISGSFTSVSESLADRISTAESELGNTLISGSAQIATEISGSFTSTSSSLASELLKNTTDTLTGDLTVTGTITAQDLHVQEVTSSIVYSSGSNIFGNQSSDTHQFTGSLDVIGNAELKGSSNQVGVTLNNPEARTYQIFSNGSTGGGGAANGFFAIYDNTASADRLIINSSGSVGIGTNSPARLLNIVASGSGDGSNLLLTNLNDTDGDSASIGFSMLSNDTYVKGGIFFERTANAGRGSLHLASNSDTNGTNVSISDAVLTATYDKKVGIGTQFPSSSLHVYDSTASRLTVGQYGAPHYTQSGMAYQVIRATTDDAARALLELHSGNQGTKGLVQAVGANNTVYFGSLTNSNASYGNDVEAFYFNTAGNVGLGTTNNTHKLVVKGTSAALTSDSAMRFYIDRVDATQVGSLIFSTGGASTSNGWAEIGQTGDNGDLYFKANASAASYDTRMVIKGSNGRVGIGTTSPVSLLHVYDTGNSVVNVTAGVSNYATLQFGSTSDNTRGAIEYYTGDDSLRLKTGNNSEVVRIESSGNMGIGTDGPLAPLHLHTGAAGSGATGSFQDNTALGIESTSDQYIEMLTSGGSSGQMQGILFSDNGRNAFVGYKEYTGGVANTKGEALHLAFYNYSASDSNNGIYFGTSYTPWLGVSTTHMFIKGDGNVGINNTSPTARLDVVGNSAGEVILKLQRNGVGSYDYFVSDAGAGGQQLILRANTADSGFIFQPKTSGGANTSAMIIGPDGNVGIGTTSPDYGKLNVWDTTAGSSIRTIADITNGTDVNINIKLTNVGHSSPYAEIASYSTTPLVFQHAQGGNVGIGTTSPIYKLQVQKTSASVPAFMVGGAYSGGPRIQTYGLDADSNAWMGLGTDMAGFPYEHSVYFPQRTGYDGILTFGSYDGTTYSTKMAIRSTGNIGVGATSPKAQLHIQSGGSYNNTDANNRLFIEYSAGSPYILFSSPDGRDQGIHFHNTTDNAFVGRIAYQHRSAGDKMWFRVGTSSGDGQVIINSDGNLGVGTDVMNSALHVYRTSGTVGLALQSSTYYGYMFMDQTYVGFASNIGTTGQKLRVHRSAPDNALTINSDSSVSVQSSKVTLWQEIGPATTEVSFTGAHNSQLTLNPSSIPSAARFVLADVFITADASDHQNFMFSKTSVGSQKNWVNTRGQQPSGQFGTLTGQFITILTYNGESDGYSPNYGMWYANQHLPINSSRQVYINNYGNSNSNGYIYIIVKAFTY